MKQKMKFKQTEIGMIPEDWEVKKIGETANILTGFPFKGNKYSNEGIKVLRGENVSLGFIRWDTEKRWNEDFNQIKKYSLREKDVVIGMDGSRVGRNRAVISNKELPLILAQRVTRLRAKENLNQLFLGQIILSKRFYNYVESIKTGTSIPHISSTQISEFIIPLPSLPEQKAIAKILSDLDSKIETLQNQNETLEKMGQLLFKRWFVDFEFPDENGRVYRSNGGEMVESELGEIPVGWRVGKLGEIVDNIKIPLNSKNLEGRKYIPIDEIPKKKIGLDSFKPISEAKSGLIAFEDGDILFGAMRCYFHRVNFSTFPGVTRTTTMILRPKEKRFLSHALFLINLEESVNYANQHSKGSTMPYAVWNNSFENMACVIPSVEIRRKFNDLIKENLEGISNNIIQIQSLTKLRDTLLPRLMGGKVRVK